MERQIYCVLTHANQKLLNINNNLLKYNIECETDTTFKIYSPSQPKVGDYIVYVQDTENIYILITKNVIKESTYYMCETYPNSNVKDIYESIIINNDVINVNIDTLENIITSKVNIFDTNRKIAETLAISNLEDGHNKSFAIYTNAIIALIISAILYYIAHLIFSEILINYYTFFAVTFAIVTFSKNAHKLNKVYDL